ncbi:permease [Marseilla massiliensis]|nr:permease [Marseilla massiliensis]
MNFATLTEEPIIQGLLASCMGDGPALALLLAGRRCRCRACLSSIR